MTPGISLLHENISVYSVLSAPSSPCSRPPNFSPLESTVFCGSAVDSFAPDGGFFRSEHKVQPSRFTELFPSRLEEGIDRTKQRQLQIVICDATGTKKRSTNRLLLCPNLRSRMKNSGRSDSLSSARYGSCVLVLSLQRIGRRRMKWAQLALRQIIASCSEWQVQSSVSALC
jgi:hypothetical protein